MLAALAGRLFHQAFAAENTPEDMRAYLAEHFTEAALARLLADPACEVLVLEDAGTPVGWALLIGGGPAPRSPGLPPAQGAELEIRRFYVEPRLHGGEAAPSLLVAALERARARGAGAVWLAVWQHNTRAQSFYGKHGFR